jgi:hypothetical protein
MIYSGGFGPRDGGPWGTATDGSGGIAMSSMVMDVRPFDTVRSESSPDRAEVRSHPRGRGVRVLSRIARAEVLGHYAPRHRSDDSVDVEIRTSIAS